MRLHTAEKKDYEFVKRLYIKAFPKEERQPYFLLKRRALQGRAQLLVARDEERFAGFAYLITDNDLVYLFFFAVEEGQRGSGKGSEILQLLKEKYKGKRIFLAREQLDEKAENYEQRVKRHEFYLKNGLVDLPCRIKEASVVFDVMGTGDKVAAGEYRRLMERWGGKLVVRCIGMEMLEAKRRIMKE